MSKAGNGGNGSDGGVSRSGYGGHGRDDRSRTERENREGRDVRAPAPPAFPARAVADELADRDGTWQPTKRRPSGMRNATAPPRLPFTCCASRCRRVSDEPPRGAEKLAEAGFD